MTETTMIQNEEVLGLHSMALYGSFFRGLQISLKCPGNTNLSGDNGAGKSSMLNLIPLFYGEEPERLVERAAGKASFLDFYLPTQASLIVFEYGRDDGLRCALIYRHGSGSIAYRFLSGSIEDTLGQAEISGKLMAGEPIPRVLSELKEQGFPDNYHIKDVVLSSRR